MIALLNGKSSLEKKKENTFSVFPSPSTQGTIYKLIKFWGQARESSV